MQNKNTTKKNIEYKKNQENQQQIGYFETKKKTQRVNIKNNSTIDIVKNSSTKNTNDTVNKNREEEREKNKNPKKKKNNSETNKTKHTKKSKKTLYIDIDDEITTLINTIKGVKEQNIYIVVPRNANLFRSIINLKILKRKSLELKKQIFFITDDKNGVYLSKKIGITVYNQANASGNLTLFSVNDSEEKKIKPLKASVNSVSEDKGPVRITEKKISISQILNKKKKIINGIKISKISNKNTKKKNITKQKKSSLGQNRRVLIGVMLITFFIMLIIAYIALPGATIYITPSANVIEKSMNITLADYKKNKSAIENKTTRMVATYPIEVTISKTIEYNSTGKILSENGKNSSGKINIINRSNNDWGLVTQTRFQTESGLVYRIHEPVTVPAARDGKWGEIEATVYADETDAYGATVGERGNIEATSFFIPGLSEENRSLLSAEGVGSMTGGVTDFKTIVTEDDIMAAKKTLREKLLKAVKSELKKKVEDKGNIAFGGDGKYILLDDDDAIQVGDVKTVVPEGLLNSGVNKFKVTGTVTATGIYYKKEEMLEILRGELMTKKSPTKELLRINDESLSYRVFEVDNVAGRVKITANIKGIEQFNIDFDTNDGQAFIEKIRDHVLGMKNENAKSFIQNLPEVNNVEIDNWPAWAPTLPKMGDNMKFEVRDAVYAN